MDTTSEQDRQRAGALNATAERLRVSGRYAEAEPLYRAALDIYDRRSMRSTVPAAICQDNLGTLLAETHRFAEAVQQHRQALSVFAQHPDNPIDYAICANNLGMAYALSGDHRAAEQYLSQAEAVHRGAGSDGLAYAGVLVNLARISVENPEGGDLAAAERLLLRAMDICHRVGPDGEHLVVQAAAAYGSVLTFQGRLAEAKAVLESAVEGAVLLLGSAHPDAQVVRANLADVYGRLGEQARAVEDLTGLLTELTEAETSSGPLLEAVRVNLARLHEQAGRPEAAFPLLAAGVESELLRLRDLTRIATRQEAAAALRHNNEYFVTFLGFAVRQRDRLTHAPGIALQFWMERRALAADVLATLVRPSDDTVPPEARADARRLGELKRQIDADVRISSARFVRSLDEWIARNERLNVLRAEAEDIERRLVPMLPGPVVSSSGSAVDPARLAALLSERDVLLECCALAPGSRPETAHAAQDSRLVDRAYVVFVVRGDEGGRVRLIELGAAPILEKLVADFGEALRSGADGRDLAAPTTTGAAPSDDVEPQLRERLASGLTAPLQVALAGADHVVVCPDGALCVVPFQALPSPGGQGYWVDDYQVDYLPSALDLLERTHPAPRQGPVLIGAPRYSLAPGVDGPYRPLEGARAEVVKIASRLGVEPLLEEKATKAAVTALHGPVLLHIASHGFFDDRYGGVSFIQHETGVFEDDPYADPEFTRLARLVGADTRPPVKSVTVTDGGPYRDEPGALLLSGGLALAGANDHWEQRRSARFANPESFESGELLAADIVQLDLRGTALAVLSACDTGRGQIIPGEAVWGLQLAVRLAGAASVVMSLWRVDDDATAELMDAFYDRILHGLSVGAALRAASKAVRSHAPHPRYWAPFICLGDSRPLVAQLLNRAGPATIEPNSVSGRTTPCRS